MKNKLLKWKWLVAGFVAAYVLGFLGYYKLLGNNDWFSAAFYSLQMVFFNPPYSEKPIPIELHIGRWLGSGIFIYWTYQVITLILNRPFLWFRKNHLIICGLNEFSIAIALDAKKNGKQPVVITPDPNSKDVKQLMRQGVSVIIGNPADITALECARIQKADTLFVLCDDDEINIQIARRINQEVFRPKVAKKLQGFFFLNNPDLRATLIQNSLFPDSTMNIRWFDQYTPRARKALFNLSLDHIRLPEESDKNPKIIIIGFGHMGQSLALQTARVAHFPSSGRLKIHIVDQENRIQNLHHLYPHLEFTADLEWIGDSLADAAVRNRVATLCTAAENSGQILACAVCHDDANKANFIEACSLSRLLPNTKVPVLYYQTTQEGIHPLMDSWKAKAKKPIPFGMKEDIWTWISIIDEEQDKFARAIHKIYCEQLEKAHAVKKGDLPVQPAEKPWEEIDETFRESNRQQADHMDIKLWAIHCERQEQNDADGTEFKFTDHEVELLARMEHARWNADRFLDGWQYAPVKDKSLKHSPYLLDWNDPRLPEDIKDYDRNAVRNMPDILKETGEIIVRKAKN